MSDLPHVLIIIFQLGDHSSIVMQEFYEQERCEKAKTVISQAVRKRVEFSRIDLATCVKQ